MQWTRVSLSGWVGWLVGVIALSIVHRDTRPGFATLQPSTLVPPSRHHRRRLARTPAARASPLGTLESGSPPGGVRERVCVPRAQWQRHSREQRTTNPNEWKSANDGSFESPILTTNLWIAKRVAPYDIMSCTLWLLLLLLETDHTHSRSCTIRMLSTHIDLRETYA